MTSVPLSPENPDVQRILPAGFATGLRSQGLPGPLVDTLLQALESTSAEVSVRFNVLKGVHAPVDNRRIPWYPEGIYLDQRPPFTFDVALHQGLYYVQDASSMILGTLARMLAPERPVRWLDTCAAPGGKTTAVLENLPVGSLMVANEFDGRRANALVENLERGGHVNTIVTGGDTSRLCALTDFFDVVAVDAPCSGEGMMRKEAVAVTQWSPSLVEQCASLQRQIIDNVWPALRPGGYFIYSTCTFNVHEDEENVRYIIDRFGAEAIDTGLAGKYGISGAVTGDAPCLRFFPGFTRGEGLFLCVLRKPGDGTVTTLRTPRKLRTAPLPSWIKGKMTGLELCPGILYAVPEEFVGELHEIQRHCKIISAGVPVALLRGKSPMPTQGLACSQALDRQAFPNYEVDYDTAMEFLHGHALVLPEGTPQGMVLLTFRNRPLGFVKNIGKRANNPLPPERCIKSPVPSGPQYYLAQKAER